jgi:hypothetical protein
MNTMHRTARISSPIGRFKRQQPGRRILPALVVITWSVIPMLSMGGGIASASPAPEATGALAPQLAADPDYSVIDVPNAQSTDVTWVNNMGVVAGYYDDATGQHGFIDSSGTITAVDVPGSNTTEVASINDAGTVTGSYWNSAGTVEHGFVRYANGTFTVLDDPDVTSGDQWGTIASDVSNSNEVVGSYFTTDLNSYTYPDGNIGSATTYHGFVWKNGQFTTYDAPGAQIGGLPRFGDATVGHQRCERDGRHRGPDGHCSPKRWLHPFGDHFHFLRGANDCIAQLLWLDSPECDQRLWHDRGGLRERLCPHPLRMAHERYSVHLRQLPGRDEHRSQQRQQRRPRRRNVDLQYWLSRGFHRGFGWWYSCDRPHERATPKRRDDSSVGIRYANVGDRVEHDLHVGLGDFRRGK